MGSLLYTEVEDFWLVIEESRSKSADCKHTVDLYFWQNWHVMVSSYCFAAMVLRVKIRTAKLVGSWA